MWQFLRGYVILQIEGFSIARLMKRMSENGIRMRSVTRTSPTAVQMTIESRRFFELRRLQKGLPVRIHILKKYGFPFVLKKLYVRPALWIGTILIAAGLFWASGSIFLIRIEGTVRTDPDEVRALLKEHGLFVGARPKGPILITAANDLSVQLKDAAWVGLDREGITLTVRVVENLPESEKRATNAPSDVIAERDGVITQMLVTHGQASVSVGDYVRAGDVLIAGTVVWKDASYETWADGVVKAAVTYEAERALETTVTERVESGRTETLRAVQLGAWKIFGMSASFEEYRVLHTETIAVSDRLPIYLEEITLGEIVRRERTPDRQEAEQRALIAARDAALESVPKDAAILSQYSTLKTKNGDTCAVAKVIAEETIGRTEERPHGGKHGKSD